MRTQVSEFMSTSVIAAQSTDTVGAIRKIMHEEKVHAIPIVYNSDGNVMVQGIITSTDLCGELSNDLYIEDAFESTKVHVISPNSGAKSAADMMLKHKVHHLVVMENGKLVGMVSSLDFVRLVSERILDEMPNEV